MRVERPATAGAVQRAVAAAAASGLPVKPVGSGHSFTGIAVAPGVQLDLTDLVTHRLPLEEAPHGYEIFRDKEEDCIKVVLKPSAG